MSTHIWTSPHHEPRAVRALIPHLDFYGESRPRVSLGGDLFDFVPLPGGALAMCIGEADFPISRMQVFLRTRVADLEGDAAAVVAEANKFVCETAPGDLSGTLFCVRLDPDRREMRYASARHLALLLRKKTGRARELETTGTVLGLSPRVKWQERRIPADPGDLIAAFSGEAREQEVLRVIREDPQARARTLVSRILYETGCRTAVVARFLGDEECELEEETAELAVA